MTTERGPQTDSGALELVLGGYRLPVSNLSSLLRVLQAALREVARSDDATRQPFLQRPHPVLHLSTQVSELDLVLRFTFVDPLDGSPLPQLSSSAFNTFLDEFSRFLKTLPQRGLWGDSASGAPRRHYESDVARRFDQVRLELRRLSRATLKFNNHTISFEGDQLDIA